MRDYRDAKAMARRLREALAQKGVPLTHTDCLELIARSFGLKDWQVMAALIEAASPSERATAEPPLWSGPALLLRDIVVFPKQTVPVFVGRAMSKLALADAYQGEQEVLLVTQKDRADDDPPPEAIYRVGVVADVLERTVLPAGEIKLLVRSRQRATVVRFGQAGGFRTADATLEPAVRLEVSGAADLARSALAALQAYAAGRANLLKPGVAERLAEIRSPGVLADLITALLDLDIPQKQRLLETRDPGQRLEAVTRLISQATAAAA